MCFLGRVLSQVCFRAGRLEMGSLCVCLFFCGRVVIELSVDNGHMFGHLLMGAWEKLRKSGSDLGD